MDHQPTCTPEPTNGLLTILADDHCRTTLTHLRDSSTDVATVEELAAEFERQDHGGPDTAAVLLHHRTLPRLDEAGVVEYDARSNTARYRGHPELETLLAAIADR